MKPFVLVRRAGLISIRVFQKLKIWVRSDRKTDSIPQEPAEFRFPEKSENFFPYPALLNEVYDSEKMLFHRLYLAYMRERGFVCDMGQQRPLRRRDQLDSDC